MTTDTTTRRAREDQFTADQQVYEPHRVGLPPIGPYVREIWRRREFAREMSRTTLRTQHFNTFFGQLWLIINPLLLAAVYFLLVDILRRRGSGPDFFGHLVATLFAYYFFQQTLNQAVKSVVSGGRLILNTAFPRVLLPLSSVITAFARFLPTMGVYAVVHVVTGLPLEPVLLWAIPILAILVLLSTGLAMLVAAVQVYFRDLKDFLPYVLRMGLYLSPILYYADEVPEAYDWILTVNPLGPILTAWSDVLNQGQAPDVAALGLSLLWAIGLFVVGAVFFLSREREFAVRL